MNTKFRLEAVDETSLKTGDSFLQSKYWALLKSNFGWKPYYFLLDDKNFIVLVRKLSIGFSIVYVPFAPPEEYAESLGKISLSLKPHLPEDSLFIRYDLPWVNIMQPPGKLKKGEDIQPPDTVIVDTSLGKEKILSEMKSKTRYNIKLAEKKGVVIKKLGIDSLRDWYNIYLETAERDKITLHSYEYYEKIFEFSQDKSLGVNLDLYMAEFEGENIAGIVTCSYNKKTTYLYGASRNTHREKMPAYALQWKAINDAIDNNCVEYDMFGIPPDDDPQHPMHGLYRFKTGFGGKIIHRPGCWDFPFKKAKYNIYRKAEAARYFYYKKLKKK